MKWSLVLGLIRPMVIISPPGKQISYTMCVGYIFTYFDRRDQIFSFPVPTLSYTHRGSTIEELNFECRDAGVTVHNDMIYVCNQML